MEISTAHFMKLIDVLSRIATAVEELEETVRTQDVGEHLEKVSEAINLANPL